MVWLQVLKREYVKTFVQVALHVFHHSFGQNKDKTFSNQTPNYQLAVKNRFNCCWPTLHLYQSYQATGLQITNPILQDPELREQGPDPQHLPFCLNNEPLLIPAQLLGSSRHSPGPGLHPHLCLNGGSPTSAGILPAWKGEKQKKMPQIRQKSLP